MFNPAIVFDEYTRTEKVAAFQLMTNILVIWKYKSLFAIKIEIWQNPQSIYLIAIKGLNGQ